MNIAKATQRMALELLARQQGHLGAIREDRITHQEQLNVTREAHNAQMAVLREELKLHREELQAMHRFNQQTRRLWILIARNMNWLGEDEEDYFD